LQFEVQNTFPFLLPQRDFLIKTGLELAPSLGMGYIEVDGWSGLGLYVRPGSFINSASNLEGDTAFFSNVHISSTTLQKIGVGSKYYSLATSLFVDACIEGTSAYITRNYAIYCNGGMFVLDSAEFTGRIKLNLNVSDALIVGNSTNNGIVGIKLLNTAGSLEFGIASVNGDWNSASIGGDSIIRSAEGRNLLLSTGSSSEADLRIALEEVYISTKLFITSNYTDSLLVGKNSTDALTLMKIQNSLGDLQLGVIQFNNQFENGTLAGGTILTSSGNLTLSSGSNWNLLASPAITSNFVTVYTGNGSVGTITVSGGTNVYPIGRFISLTGFSTTRLAISIFGDGTSVTIGVPGGNNAFPIGQSVILSGFGFVDGTRVISGGNSDTIIFLFNYNSGFLLVDNSYVSTVIDINGPYTVTGGSGSFINIATSIRAVNILGNCIIQNYPNCNVYGSVTHIGNLVLDDYAAEGGVRIITPFIEVDNLINGQIVICDIIGTLVSLAAGTEFTTLTMIGGLPTWGLVGLTTGVSGVLPVVNGKF